MNAAPRPVMLWLLPVVALPALLPLSDPARNQSAFLLLNQVATHLPDRLWSVLTVLGDTLVALVLLLLFPRRRPDLILAVLLASLPAFLLTHALKEALEVARPYAVLGDQAHVIGRILVAGAFPSGHTATVFVLVAVLAAGLRPAGHGSVWLLVAALLVGLSRIAVGAHWPLDVIGGMLCGWGCGLLGLHWARRLDWTARPAMQHAMRLFLIACALALLTDYSSGYPLARPFEQFLAVAALATHLLPGWRLENTA